MHCHCSFFIAGEVATQQKAEMDPMNMREADTADMILFVAVVNTVTGRNNIYI